MDPELKPARGALPARIAVDLLMADGAEVRARALTDTLNEVMAPSELHFARTDSREGIVLSAGRMHVLLEGRSGPLPDGRLAVARGSALGAVLGEDWRAAIADHTAALSLTVGTGASPDAPKTELEAALSRELFDLMLTVAHVAATFLAGQCTPLAVHWGPSAQLFLPERFLAMADMLFPLPLFLHPRPVVAAKGWHGFDLLGAELFTGCAVRMAPAPLPADWLFERALAYVAHTRAMGSAPGPGDTFATQPGERLLVEAAEDGALCLVVTERDGVPVPRADAMLDLAA